jgi:hypothetical protein
MMNRLGRNFPPHIAIHGSGSINRFSWLRIYRYPPPSKFIPCTKEQNEINMKWALPMFLAPQFSDYTFNDLVGREFFEPHSWV